MLDLFFIIDLIPDILKGLMITLELSIISFIIGFVIAAIFMPARIFGGTLFASIVRSYIEVFRGTPLLVQLLLIYFGLPSLGIKFDPMTASILAFGLNSAAYQSEILRSSLKSIPESQFLSGESLGMSSLQIYRYIILPQAVRVAVPALVNELVTLIKESSIASIIGVVELTRRGEYLVATTFRALEVYIAVAIIYFVICFLVSQSTRLLERKFRIPGYERGGG
ncbi:MAG: amino acid ABC transporter permease [Thermoproteales archaeon]|nr:amino acid ABC transporter permease [Thermoproteales archaeon]